MKKIILAIMILLFLSPAAFSKKVGGVLVPDSITIDGKHLVLNGAGERVKKVVFVNIHIYAAGLYLSSRESDAGAIIDADEPMAIRLYMITNMASKERLQQGWTAGFKRATAGKTGPIKKEIEKFNRLFKNDPKEGDMYEIYYIPGKGVSVAFNGKVQGDAISGNEFKKAVFGIWLSDAITDSYFSDLKARLLGK